MIEIKNLKKYYNKGKSNQIRAVDDTTLCLPNSGMIAFFGKSGCGKTTLLNIIGGLDSAQQGSVVIDGERITPNSDTARNRRIGYIFQNYNLSLQMDIFENVASSLRLCGVTDKEDIERRVTSALKSVDMEKYRKRNPSELSGGQQQRVAIARAIVKNPEVILADEPTGNLDEQNTVMVMDLLKEISKERLVLLVTHEQELVDLYCDEVIEIVDGKVTDRYSNEITEGFSGKRVNDVYLGDMELDVADGENISVDCFGEFGDKKLKLRLISNGGVIYISAPDGVKMKFADSSSEIKIHEGKFEEKPRESHAVLDEYLKTPVKHGKSGRIYHFKNALKSAYKSSFGRKKKGRKALVATLVCFSMIIVLMVSLYGSVFYSSSQIKRKYNTNTVFVRADALTQKQIESLSGKYDNIHVTEMYYTDYYNSYDEYSVSVTFGRGHFQTINEPLGIEVSGNIFPESAILNREVLLGRATDLKEGEVVISKAVADYMLEITDYQNIKSYDDLVGLSGDAEIGWNRGYSLEIVGIVRGDDMAMYTNNLQYAKMIMNGGTRSYSGAIKTVGDYGIENVDDGDLYVVMEYYGGNPELPAIGTQTTFQGKTFKIAGYINSNGDIIDINNENVDQDGKDYGAVDDDGIVDPEQTLTTTAVDMDVWVKDDVSDSFEIVESNYYISGIAVSDNDLIDLISSFGKTDDFFTVNSAFWSQWDSSYYAIHSDNIDILVAEIKGMTDEYNMVTPDDIYENLSSSQKSLYTGLTIALVVVVCVMSLCLFLIMRSSIMADVKQIGIYRAIGVSKKNVTFRYLIESCLVFCLTVLPGYAVSTYGISRIISLMGNVIKSTLYYPVWLAMLTFVGLLCVSIVCGLLPVRSLLRKTPSEIISKYDI